MGNSRLDYSEVVYALQQNRKGEANELLDELMERLKDYLQVVLDAEEHVAEDCTQEVFLNVYEQIMNGNIEDEKYIFKYLITSCRREYFRYSKGENRFDNNAVEDNPDHFVKPAEQIKNLLDEEREKILEVCLKELRDKSRTFIEYFMTHPKTTTKKASSHFNISGASVRTKKHRILDRLHQCVKRKLKQ